jgi:hypothetical protein
MSAKDGDVSFNSDMWLEVRDYYATYLTNYHLGSTGASGVGLWGTDVDITVDNYNNFYTLAWTNNGVTGTDMALCGVIVTYEVASGASFMPLVTR